MVAVAYKRWSFTRGSNCKALTGNVLVHEFWISGLLWEVVSHGGSTVTINRRNTTHFDSAGPSCSKPD